VTWRRWIGAAWVLALLAHHLLAGPTESGIAPGMRTVDVPSPEGRIRIAYYDENADAGVAVLLLHGSPGAAHNFDQLRAHLPDSLRVVRPDLPGFGASTRTLEDYSFSRHAVDMLALMDALALPSSHLVGMSMGGGVAIEMARLAPERVQSITLLSSIGLQEHELTGDYWTNRFLHVVQTGTIWMIDHLVPHFGWLDSGGQARSYARNFLDSDQRILRDTLLRWSGPTLIVHGEQDFLVPVAAARAHAQVVPQAVVDIFDPGSHFLIWTRPDAVAGALVDFLGQARGGTGLAPTEREDPPVGQLIGPGRWILLVLLGLAAAVAPPLATWWFLPFALAGRAGWFALAAALLIGVGVRCIARNRRRPATVPRVWIVSALGVVAHGSAMLALAGVFSARSVPGLAAALLLWFGGGLAAQALTRRGRARLRGGWLRLVRWEYWSSWAIYAPIAPRLWWRARGYGGLRVATCVNPALPLGGLVGESKSQILRLIGERPEIPRWCLVPPGELPERVRTVEDFAATLESPWPIVLKPDRGERGTGVRIVRTPAERDAVLRRLKIPVIAQEYLSGEEYGILWLRSSDRERGEVFSVSHKAAVHVEGDGSRTLQELIYAQPRAVPFLHLHLAAHAGELDRIPRPAECVRISQLGTHSLGATFLDSMQLRSDDLVEALDRIMEGTGLDFGRFDVMVPSASRLSRGRELRIIEFNGLSSEAAHLYDPANSLRTGTGVLLAQWTEALRIGASNREAGTRPASSLEILRAVRAHHRDRSTRGV
jgi:pimeloyl-ACP methyl ester carboxylesterase